jgi:hypothetical protein
MSFIKRCGRPAKREWSPLTFSTNVGGKPTDPVTNVNFCRCITYFLLMVYIKPQATFMHGYNHIEHYEEQHYHTHTHTHDTSDLQPNIFLTEIGQLVVRNNGRSAFPTPNHCQGQLQAPQSVSVGKYHLHPHPSQFMIFWPTRHFNFCTMPHNILQCQHLNGQFSKPTPIKSHGWCHSTL